MSTPWRLLGDVGGTNVRFGRCQPSGSLLDCRSWPVDKFDGFEQALSHYLSELPADLRFATAVVAGAGRVEAHAVAITNTDWQITRTGIQGLLGGDIAVRLLNDLEAVAFALPFLGDSEVSWLDDVPKPAERCGRMLAVNVGTGFGSACVIASNVGLISCPAESGHMLLGAESETELALFGSGGLARVTVEDVLSGDGIRWLYRAVLQARGEPLPDADGDSPRFAFDRTDAAASDTSRYFGDFLARTASNLALATASWDGVLLTGSVATAWADHADAGRFRSEFTGSGKMRHMLAQVPLGVIAHDWPAFIGMAHLDVD